MLRRFVIIGLVGLFLAMSLVVAEDSIETYNPNATVTTSGTCVIRVQYKDGCPRSSADVFVRVPSQYIGGTDENGQVQCNLDPGGYTIYAVYYGSQFGPDTYLGVPEGATITANYEITPPTITMLSPQNQTYDGRVVPLNFTVYDYSPISWMGYSLDEQANTTVTGNDTLNVGAGSHSVVVYANDTYGNIGSSDVIYFSSLGGCIKVAVRYVDGYPRSGANVWIISPNREVGTTGDDGDVTWCNHGLDGGDYWIKAYWPSGTRFGSNTELYVDSYGNGQATIWVNYEITPPAVEILSPQNATYAASSVPLTFTVLDYSPISWIGYSLDSQSNITITGNTTIGVEDGLHGIAVYANDSFGNMGSSQTIYFSVDTVPPTVTVLSPQNVTYSSSSIPLTFTVSEPASWMAYSLDNQANVTITGNTTLTGLIDGSYMVRAYANDTVGNMGSSVVVYFTVGTTFHDVAVLDVAGLKTVVGQGYTMKFNVTVENHGNYTETFNVTAYVNTTVVGTLTNITLASGNSTTVTFTWNTSGFAKGNYTLSAYACPVQGETYTSDNSLAGGTVHVGVPGNVNYFDGSRMVDMIDLWLIQKHYGAIIGDARYVPNYDIDGGGKIDMIDLWIAQKHFGQTEP